MSAKSSSASEAPALLPDPDRGLGEVLLGDGRPLLAFTGLVLILCGLFALYLAATGQFLPHDERYLGMTAEELCAVQGCRVVHFMIHDRASFGGALVAVGILYMWLAEFPLRRGEAWAWWAFALSGAAGFGSFLAYLGYGYLDAWHAAATLALLPAFAFGLLRSYRALPERAGIGCLLRPGVIIPWRARAGVGRACLLASAAGTCGAGLVILVVGMTCVFVPEDIAYMGLTAGELHELNPRLVPLIAHDRAGFGGALGCCGMLGFLAVWCGRPSRSLWQALALAGLVGFGTAIGVHPLVGYNDPRHLAPAIGGALLWGLGLILTGVRGGRFRAGAGMCLRCERGRGI